ncbi:MAG TPA: TPM domain-containing protein, partial [Thermoanaerobaculia bacterium]|nr:TPM domain-containing protein [Thermoanaerobaculia bacterium]
MKLPFRAATFAHRVLLAGLVLAGLPAPTMPAHAVTVEEISTPRPSGWTVDLTGTLPSETVAELNRLGDEVKAKSGSELVVVVVGTTGGVEPREFATRLFNHWGIGERDKNNGLLVFAALDDRAAEIVLGDGVDDSAQVQASEEIMQGVMVPRFREGDSAGAMLQGATACASRILGASSGIGVEPPVSPRTAKPLTSPQPTEDVLMPQINLVIGCFAAVGLILLLIRPDRCPSCSARTLTSSSVTLSEATCDTDGTVQITESCTNCPHSRSYTTSTPRLS